ncbi:MAG: glycosyltransferase [Chlamydiales bacterium]
MKKKKQIVILTDGFLNWNGGVDFITMNITALLAVHPAEEVEITLVLPEKKFFSNKKRLLLRVPILKKLFTQQAVKRDLWLSGFNPKHFCFARFGKKRINRLLRKLKADAALFCWSDTPIEGCRTIGYYPDLQHRYYPQYFTKEECTKRDQTIQRILHTRHAIFVTALEVKRDLEKFYPKTECKLIPLPFAPVLPDIKWLNPLSEDVQAKYGISSPYFMISNQFWVHKGHRTAFEALKKLPSHIHLVCTGKEEDFRFPTFYRELLLRIEELGLQERVHLLGLIPKREQIELMKGAIAIVQPTLFEGGPGGGSVQTAIALGLPAIVSDIPVNREISDDDVCFFRTNDSQDLFIKMESALNATPQRPSHTLLLQKREANIQKLGKTLLKAVG